MNGSSDARGLGFGRVLGGLSGAAGLAVLGAVVAAQLSPAIISTGHRTFVDRGNRRTMQQFGVAVFVDATLEECLKDALEHGLLRIDDPNNERFSLLYEAQRPEYESADVIVEPMGRDPETVADEIMQRLEDRVWSEKLT